ncbi:hypothetical protein ACTXGQ_22595, partial [Marinobacter sp. 1Y8]
MKKIRLGIFVEDETLAWHKFMPLKSLVDEGIVEVCIAIQRSAEHQSNPSHISKIIPSINQKLFSILSHAKKTTKRYSIHDLVPNGKMPVVTSISRQGESNNEIEDSVIKRLQATDLDYLLSMDFRNLIGKALGVTKHGILLLHYGDERIQRGGPALYWQFAEQWENSVVTLQLLSNDDDVDKVVGRGYGSLFYWDYNLTEDKLKGVA